MCSPRDQNNLLCLEIISSIHALKESTQGVAFSRLSSLNAKLCTRSNCRDFFGSALRGTGVCFNFAFVLSLMLPQNSEITIRLTNPFKNVKHYESMELAIHFEMGMGSSGRTHIHQLIGLYVLAHIFCNQLINTSNELRILEKLNCKKMYYLLLNSQFAPIEIKSPKQFFQKKY